MKKILIFSDTHPSQINGVVTTLNNTIDCLINDYEVILVDSSCFKSYSLPTYKEIKLCFPSKENINYILDLQKPDYVHIATEGPIGLVTRKVMKKRKEKYSSSFHTKYAEYIESRMGFGSSIVWKWLKHVYKNDEKTLVTTQSMKNELIEKGFDKNKLFIWSRGVSDIFKPIETQNNSKPVLLNVGRVSEEKNLESFYKSELDSIKIQVGDGPMLEKYKQKYKDVIFVGSKQGNELVEYYNKADVFVFPSKSDTFGLVMIESMRCGVPVAAYPVIGPIDVVEENKNGSLNNNLDIAISNCLRVSKEEVLKNSEQYNWKTATNNFINCLVEK